MTEHVMKLDELIPQLKWCGYECEAGKLECNIAFRQIAHIIERLDYTYNQQRKEFNPDAFTKHEYYVECQTCKVDIMIVFQCSNCDKKYPCVIITDDADAPEYCPWTGRKDGCDWNARHARLIP